MDGIFGGIIISEPDSPPGIPLVMFDWFQTNSLDLVTSNPFDQGIGMAHCNAEKEGFSFAGVKVSSLCMDSILVNGYGQYRNPSNHSDGAISIRETYLVPEAETFVIIHLIHAGFEFPLRFYRHDRERLDVIETDGGGLESEQVDDLIIGLILDHCYSAVVRLERKGSTCSAINLSMCIYQSFACSKCF